MTSGWIILARSKPDSQRMLGIDGLPGLRLPAAMRQMRSARGQMLRESTEVPTVGVNDGAE